MDPNEMDFDTPTVTVKDETGRSLDCFVEQSLEIENQEYVLLLPVDSPVEIFAWRGDDEEEEEAEIVEDAQEISEIFATAKAVLSEQNLVLKRTAVVLTVEGDLPDFEEEALEEEGFDPDGEQEELQLLATFYHEDQEYAVYTPLDPYFILARLDAKGNPELLSPEELQRLEPMLAQIEDQLFDSLE
jgi:hypothetical protein